MLNSWSSRFITEPQIFTLLKEPTFQASTVCCLSSQDHHIILIVVLLTFLVGDERKTFLKKFPTFCAFIIDLTDWISCVCAMHSGMMV